MEAHQVITNNIAYISINAQILKQQHLSKLSNV